MMRTHCATLFIATTCMALVAPATAATLHVPADFPTIQAAIDAASGGDTVMVAAGTYSENLVWEGKALFLIGAGAGSSSVDGGGAGSCLVIRNVPAPARVEGFTFKNGHAEEGGGVFIAGSSVTVAGNRMVDNGATAPASYGRGGGGVHLEHSSAVVMGNTISENAAVGCGGGVHFIQCALQLTGNTIRGNSAEAGGGVQGGGDPGPAIANNTITGNVSTASGGGLHLSNCSPTVEGNWIVGNAGAHAGGAVFWRAAGSFTGNYVAENVAGRDGGGVQCAESSTLVEGNTIERNRGVWGGGVMTFGYPCPTIRGNTITHNTATEVGGGIDVGDSAPAIEGNTISGNWAGVSGGGVFLTKGAPTVIDNTIAGNWAELKGGGVQIQGGASAVISGNTVANNEAGSQGGGVAVFHSAANVTENAIERNKAAYGAGMHVGGYPSPTVSDNRITENSASRRGGGLNSGGADPTVARNTIANNEATWGGGVVFWRSGGSLAHNQISSNAADWIGGGVAVWESSTEVTGNSLTGNQATDAAWGDGGGLYIYQSSGQVTGNTVAQNRAYRWGGGACIWYESPLRFAGNTVSRNEAGSDGGGLALLEAAVLVESNAIEQNVCASAGGVYVSGDPSPTLAGNTIASNTSEGVSCADTSAAVLSGDTIHSNEGAGVVVLDDATVTVTQCSIYDNGGLGIDLGNDGVTLNDPGDADTGPNELLNFPEFTDAEVSGGSVVVKGNAPPDSTVEIFQAAPDPTGYGEGKTFLTSAVADGDGVFTATIPGTGEPITATATDANGNTSEFSEINLPPVADAGEEQTAEQASPEGAQVTLDGTASYDPDGDELIYEWDLDGDGEYNDAVGPSPTVTLGPGTHVIGLRVTDPSGKSDTDTVTVTVADATPPAIAPPPDVSAEQTSLAGTQVDLGQPTVQDLADPNPAVTNNAPDVFPLGTTVVTWTATDASGNSATCQQTVTVVDTTPPALTVPGDITAEQESHGGSIVTFTCSATDVCDADVQIDCQPPSGSVFPLGGTQVTCSAADDASNQTVKQFTVTVVDTTAPQMTFTVLESTLWPPNRQMHLCATVSDVSDLCDTDPAVSIVVTSNEPIVGPGEGNADPDWDIIANNGIWEIWLRAEHAAGSGDREYHIEVTVTDASGNQAQAGATVIVPGSAAPQ